MGEDEHGIIIQNIFPQMVFLQNLSVRDGPDDVRAFRVHDVHVKMLRPAMLFHQLHVSFRMVAHAACRIAVCGVAFHNGTIHFLYHGLPELRTQKILISLFSGMNLDRHFSGQFHAQSVIQLNHLFRRNFTGKINLCLHCRLLSFLLLQISSKRLLTGFAPGSRNILTRCHHPNYNIILTLRQYISSTAVFRRPGLSRIHLLLHLRENKENLHNFYGNF